MANTIILKKSSTASAVPAAASLQPGEVAVNLADQKLYSKTVGGTVIQVGFGNLTSTMVTTALGFTPTYITASGTVNGQTKINSSTTIFDSGTTAANSVGYLGLPQNSKTAAYTLALGDAGEHISITTGGITIPANASVAFPIGTTIVIYNNSAANQTIAITTDTLRLAGTATTGSRTLAQRGLCTLVKVAATEWVATGNVT